ncbi:MAG: metalloregulator ArsR/SmtB family transcription factor [Alphaproteobacteria bacterium]|nr:metalloregulator ArsR/SmtB family transcription factor [Alphaproteobacteria bacterium]
MSKKQTSSKDIKTKRKIQEILKISGPLDASVLAEELGITAMAVRQHLYSLADEELITYEEVARPKGRPAKIWRLSDKANKIFPDAHADLSIGLINSMRQVFGEEGLQKLVRQRAEEQLSSYKKALSPATNIDQKLDLFSKKRTEEGYMASWTTNSDGSYLFVENHCPICAAATACSNLCSMEFEIIEHLFPELIIERGDHIVSGARRCAYFLRMRDI